MQTIKTVSYRSPISESRYREVIQMVAGWLGIEPPDLSRSEITLAIYDGRFDLDEPEEERCIEVDLRVDTNPKTLSRK